MIIGVDFGGTQIKAAAVRESEILATAVRMTPAAQGPTAVLDVIAEAVRELDGAPLAVGLAIPGEVDAAGRCWRLPNVPGFEGVAIAAELQARLGCPVVVDNDATAAALGEKLFGHGREYASFAMLTLGTGIGGGLVLGSRLWSGSHGFAGELGHIAIDRVGGPPCACGLLGCLESYAGTQGLLRHFGEAGGKAENILEIAQAARRGETAGLSTFEALGRALAIGVCTIQNVLDLQAFVFAGGVSASFDLFEPSLRESMQRYAFAPPLAAVPLLVSDLGNKAGVIGAAYLCSERA